MRQKILKELYFVGLLLCTDKRQRRALINNISKRQMGALIEIVYNVLHGYGSLSDKDKNYLKKYQSVIRRFVDIHASSLQRKRLLLKYINVFCRLIKSIQKYISIQWQEN